MDRQYVPHTITPSIRLSSLSLTSPLPFLPFPTPPAPSEEAQPGRQPAKAREQAAPQGAVLEEARTLLAAATGSYSCVLMLMGAAVRAVIWNAQQYTCLACRLRSGEETTVDYSFHPLAAALVQSNPNIFVCQSSGTLLLSEVLCLQRQSVFGRLSNAV